ncbi:MAG: sulfatase [Nitrospinae bacterium]|nr:sulfatase [Nitrospinota bacterium]
MVRFLLRAGGVALKWGGLLFLFAFTVWFSFFMIFALPNPDRVPDPLDILEGVKPDQAEPTPLSIHTDLINALDEAQVDVPNLDAGYSAVAEEDFFAEYPFPRLVKNGRMAISMTQGKHAMKLEQRNAVYMPTPARASFTLTVPEGARLRFANSVLGRIKGKELAPVTFTVELKVGEKAETLLKETLGPEPVFPWSETDFFYHSILKFVKIETGLWNGRWYPHDIDLTSHAGKNVTITFTTSSNSVSHGFIGNPRVYAPETEPKPNVIIAVLDTVRADFIGANNPDVSGLTPNMDKAAVEGINFKNTRSHGNWSRGSFATIFTGMPTPRFGFSERWSYTREEKQIYNRRQIPSLAEEFRKDGYTTVSVGNNPFVYDGGPVGLHLGFDQAVDIQRQPFDTETSTSEAVRWLKDHADERFMMMFSLNTAHSPFRPPLKYFIKGFRGFKDSIENTQPFLFRGVVAYADDFFGKFMTALDRLKMADNTIVVVTADHGVILRRSQKVRPHPGGEYELVSATHTHTLYEEEARVPLIVRQPGNIPPGRVSNEQVGLFDIAPSVMALAEVKSDARWAGESFAKIATGEKTALDESAVGRILPAEGETVRSMVTADGYKYIRRGLDMPRVVDGLFGDPRSAAEEVYDLRNDPGETVDLFGANPSLVQKLRKAFEERYPQSVKVHKLLVRGGKELTSLTLTLETTGRFVFVKSAPGDGNKNIKTAVEEQGPSKRIVKLDGIGGHVRVFYEVFPNGAPVTITASDSSGKPLGDGVVRLGPVLVPAKSGPVTVSAGDFHLEDSHRLIDERMLREGVGVGIIPFATWRKDVSEGARLDPELAALMKKWGYL